MVLYLGGLIREKGIFTLLASVPAVLARQPRTQFVFAGEWTLPRDREEAEQLVQMLRVTEAVQFLGVVVGTAKWELLARSSVLALPTFYAREALPNVLLEALAASLPVVTTRRGAISEVIEDGVNGLLVAEQDAGDLADKLAALLADPDRRALMARVNRAKYERAFTAEHFAARMADLMRQTNAR
jgi:glycosyltransferase involved in cell wall biosynthesis